MLYHTYLLMIQYCMITSQQLAMAFLNVSLRYGTQRLSLTNPKIPRISRVYIFTAPQLLQITGANTQDPNDTPILSEDFFTKQKRLKRPLSPHLTIYKPQITWTMSIAYRTTEVFIATCMSTFGIYLYFMNFTSFDSLLTALRDLQIPAPAVTAVKLTLGIPFGYFVWGGLRHIAWDRGYGFALPKLYKSAYATMVLSVLTGIGLAFYKFS